MSVRSNIKIIIQARMGSSRLPSKMNLEFYQGETLLEIIISKLLKITAASNIILATSFSQANDVLEKVALAKGIQVFRGDENNVLQRFIDAAEKFKLDKFLRICADNPFLQIDKIQTLAEQFLKSEIDYLSWYINGKRPSIKTHSGFFAEAVSLKALKKVKSLTSDKFYCEHVTNFIYENPDHFKVEWMKLEDSFLDKIRLTIDTKSDFEIAQEIYGQLNPNLTYEKMKPFLLKREDLLLSMDKNIKENEK